MDTGAPLFVDLSVLKDDFFGVCSVLAPKKWSQITRNEYQYSKTNVMHLLFNFIRN
jgi:hypothetical protein